MILWGVKSIYYVLEKGADNEYKCTIKGKILDTDFNIKGRSETTPLVVGDNVIFEKTDNNNGLIVERLDRKNEFKRLKRNGRVIQTIFANIDSLIVVDSVAHPPLRPYFIDRCLFTADYMGIPAAIVFNKIDLLDSENSDFYYETKAMYESLGYKTLETSALSKNGIDKLKELLKNKLSCFNGRSGVGKSSLVKELDPALKNIKIGHINKKYDRGIHTTTFSRIYHLTADTKIIDTPGMRELAVYVDKPEDVERHIRDFLKYRDKCKYQNCQHIDEPDCHVIKSVENGKINKSRYESYLRIRETIEKLDDSVI